MSIAIVLGTRPEIIKMSPVIRECEHKNLDYFILHTGQHYSYEMDRVFFEQVLAGALAASKLHIKVGHVEAGLRSYDRRMPEETNRVLADHCSDYLFSPTKKAKDILLGEGIPEDMIYVTGNTIVDAVRQNVKIAAERASILNELNIEAGNYLLTTAHRQENVDDRVRLTGILTGLESLAEEFDMPVIFPIHPRSRKRIQEFGISTNGSITLIEPVDFLSFLQLEKNAGLILTDSGGVQKESCILGVPCVTLRDNTERPETVEVGANVLAGTKPERILECAREMIDGGQEWENPFGDGMAGERIRRIMTMGS